MKIKETSKYIENKIISSYFKAKENAFINTRVNNSNTLEKIGNFFLTPAQYLLNGRKVTLVEGRSPKTEFLFDYEKDVKIVEVLKTVAAIIFLAPATIIGSTFKELSFISGKVRNNHNTVNTTLYPQTVEKTKKHYHGIESELFSDEVAPCMGHIRDGESPERHKYEIEALSAVAQVLNEHEIPWWVDCGTALGAYRYGGIIPWDHDVDISILMDDHDRVYKLLNATLDKTKYEIQDWSSYKKPGGLLKLYIKESETFMDLYHYTIDADKEEMVYYFGHENCIYLPEAQKVVEREMMKPLRVDQIFPLKKANFDNIHVHMPQATEEFLQAKYGDNLDPVRVWNEEKKAYVKVPDHPYWINHQK